MVTPMRAYQGQKISVPKVSSHQSLVAFDFCSSSMALMTARETNMPVMIGRERPFFQNTARARPPSSAPLVRPRKEKAAFKTNSTCRLKYAIKIKAAAQATVEALLKRKKKPSLRCGKRCL